MFDSSRKATPALVVGVSAAVDWNSYGSDRYCWLRRDNYFVLSFVIPVVVVIIVNTLFLLMSLILVCKRSGSHGCSHHASHKQQAERVVYDARYWLKGAVALVFLLGLTWCFGLLWLDERTIVFAYLFTLLNSLQGVFIFVFHVALNQQLRSQLSRRFLGSDCDCLPSLSHSYKFSNASSANSAKNGYVRGDKVIHDKSRRQQQNNSIFGDGSMLSGTLNSPLSSTPTTGPRDENLPSPPDVNYSGSRQLLLRHNSSAGKYDYATIQTVPSSNADFYHPYSQQRVVRFAPADYLQTPLGRVPRMAPPPFPPPAPPQQASPPSGKSGEEDSAYSESDFDSTTTPPSTARKRRDLICSNLYGPREEKRCFRDCEDRLPSRNIPPTATFC